MRHRHKLHLAPSLLLSEVRTGRGHLPCLPLQCCAGFSFCTRREEGWVSVLRGGSREELRPLVETSLWKKCGRSPTVRWRETTGGLSKPTPRPLPLWPVRRQAEGACGHGCLARCSHCCWTPVLRGFQNPGLTQ